MAKINKNTYTLNVIVNEFARHGVNILQLLESLDAIVTDSEDFVTVRIVENDGTETTRKLPSIGRMKKDISSIKNMLDDLYDIRNNEVFVISNGVKHPIYIPSYPYDLLPPFNLSRNIFTYKNDRFYAKFFLNNIEKSIRYRKFILSVNDEEFEEVPTTGQTELVDYLQTNDIQYRIEDHVIRTDSGKIRFNGNFFVTSNIKNLYRLNTLVYTNLENETFRLNVNDVLYFRNTEVRITEINFDTNEVKVETVKGYDSISVGTEVKLLSPFDFSENIEVPCEVDEKIVVYFKNINDTFNVESLNWSDPFKLDVSTLESGTREEINEEIGYDVNSPVDIVTPRTNIGVFNVNKIVKDKFIPARLGFPPNSPVINPDDFNVVRINDHLFQEQIVTSVQEKVSRKNELTSEISEIDKALEERKAALSSTQDISRERIRSLQNDLDTLVNKRKLKTSEYTSILNELQTINKDRVKFIKPKFRIRGFFDIPQEIFSPATGVQEIVQFVVSYRYKGLNSETSQNKNFVRTDTAGNKKFGVFSDWIEIEGPKRIKVRDRQTGDWVWEEQQTEDGQKVNINQLDIPIQKNEVVEIRIKSVSEAGYPGEPLMSEWSNVISIPFPEEITEVNDLADIIETSTTEDANLVIEDVLSARGIDFHIRNSITRNEEYFAHPSSEISSGIYDAAGNLLTLENVLKTFQTDITELRRIVQREIPELRFSLISPTGDEIEISKNSLNKIFAGYYLDDLNNIPAPEQDGAIINKEYQLFIFNTSGAPIYFRSGVPGGIGTDVNIGGYELDSERLYETVPVYYNNQFGIQKKGQWLYARAKNYKLNTNFYFNNSNAKSWYIGQSGLPTNAQPFMQSNLSTVSPQPEFSASETGAYSYINIDDIEDLYIGSPDYGATKELVSGRENGIRIPLSFIYKLTNDSGVTPTTNPEFRKRLAVDIFLFQQNTVSIDFEFITRYSRDTF